MMNTLNKVMTGGNLEDVHLHEALEGKRIVRVEQVRNSDYSLFSVVLTTEDGGSVAFTAGESKREKPHIEERLK